MQQDFFDFDEFEPPRLPLKKKRHRGKLFIFIGILVAVLAGLGTILGIFRSNDTYLAKDLRKTFSIQPPPAPELPKPKTLSPQSAGGLRQPPVTEKAVPAPVAVDHAAATQNHLNIPPKPAGRTPQGEVRTAKKAVAPQPGQPEVQQPTPQGQVPPAKKTLASAAVPKPKPAAVAGTPAGIEKKETQTTATKPPAAEAARKIPSGKAALPQPAELIKKGELTAAAGQYRRLLRQHPANYSISLEVACHRETVVRAFEHAGPGTEMFILPKKIGGKSCFAVLWGRYSSIAAAKKGKAAVPSFFSSESSLPRIVALHPMLRK